MPLLKPRDLDLEQAIGDALVDCGVSPDKLDQETDESEDNLDKQFRKGLNAVGASVENASQVLAEIMLSDDTRANTRLNAAKEVLILHGRKTKEGFAPPMVPIFQFNIQGASVDLANVFAPHQARQGQRRGINTAQETEAEVEDLDE